jgi:hypothetical protein
MTYTNNDIRLLKLHNKKVKMTVKLFDSDTYQEVDNITGNVVSASYDKQYDSDIRTTCSLTLSVKNKNKIEEDFEKTWNKRMVELICSIFDSSIGTYRNYSLGRLLMESGSTTYNATEQTIKLNLVDLMASLTESRGSQIGSDTHIPATETGTSVRNVLINIINEFAVFKRYNICDFEDTIPYDLDFGNGIYPIEMLRSVLDLFPYYEMFYDEEGIFTVQKIPTKVEDPIDIGREIIDECLISEGKESNFSEIRNTTEIWGKELECDYTAVSCVQSNETYNVTIDSSFVAYVDGDTYAVVPNADSVLNQKINIQSLGAYKVYNMSGAGTYTEIPARAMKAGMAYSIRYTQSKFVLVGELQVRCIVQEIIAMPSEAAKQYYKEQNNCNNVEWVVNPDSTYACTIAPTTGRITGEIKQVLSDGDYADIYSTDLAFERARYENWLKCRLQDRVSFEAILIPWIDINQKIQYTSPITGDVGTWIVQSVSFDFENWTMSVTASRFYPSYPW